MRLDTRFGVKRRPTGPVVAPGSVTNTVFLNLPSVANPPVITANFDDLTIVGDQILLERSQDVTFATGVTQSPLHTITAGEATANAASGFSIPTLSTGAPWYFRAHIVHSGVAGPDSNKVGWNDAVAPTISTNAAQSINETHQLAVALTGNEQIATWAITGGADQALFEISGATLQWAGNGSQSYATPLDLDANNTYVVDVQGTDLAGNSTTKTITTTVNQIDLTPDAFSFTDQNSAALSTQYSSANSITVAGLSAGEAAAITVSGGQYSKNGGAFTSSAGTVVNGDTVQARGTASGSYSTVVNVVVNIGTGSDTFSITTMADPSAAAFVASSTQPALQAGSSATSTFAAIDFQLGRPLIYLPPLNGAITVTSVTIKAAGAAGADVACTLRASEAGAGQQSIWIANSVINAAGSYDVAVVISSAQTNWGIMCGTLINAASAVPTSTASKTFASNTNPISTGTALTIPTQGVGVAFCAHPGTAPRSAVNGTLVATGLNNWGGGTGLVGMCSKNITPGSWTPSFTAAAQQFAAILAATWGP